MKTTLTTTSSLKKASTESNRRSAISHVGSRRADEAGLGERRLRRRLLSAIRRGDVPEIRSLLSIGVDPNLRDRRGRTPFMFAAAVTPTPSFLSVAKTLEAYGADPSLLDWEGMSAAMYAVVRGRAEVVLPVLLRIKVGLVQNPAQPDFN